MSASRDESELDAFLARDTALQKRWRQEAGEEPPPALDATLRDAAHRAVAAQPRARYDRFAKRWRVPLSIAAVIVVSTTITLMVAERREHVPSAAVAPPPPAPPVGSPAHEPPASPASPASAGANRMHQDSAARSGQASGAPPSRRAQTPAEEPAPPRPAAEAEAKAQTSGAPLESPGANQAGQPALRSQEGPAAAPAAPAPLRDEMQAPAAPTQAAAPDMKAEREAELPADTPSASGEVPRLREAAPARKAAADSAARDYEADPQRWVEHIRGLHDAGRLEQARTSLRELRKRHPAYQVPADLLEALR